MNEIESVLDKRWRNACRVVLRRDIGALSEYYQYLRELVEPLAHRKSSISGKDVAYAVREYAEGSKWISLDEVDYARKFEPLSINEIKDIDSLLAALAERFYYTGNIVLGNSSHVQNSSNINDSFYLDGCARMGDSKYLVGCAWGRLNEDCFGCHGPGESQFCIRCGETWRVKRAFEVWSCYSSSDCYYSHNLANCTECFFCFNRKNTRYAVGNLEIGKEKYLAVKEKLLAEIAETLAREKRMPSLVDIARESTGKLEGRKIRLSGGMEGEGRARDAVNDAFEKTAALIFGKSIGKMEEHEEWLTRHTRRLEEAKSALSGTKMLVVPYTTFSVLEYPRERVVTAEEALEIGSASRLTEAEIGRLTVKNASSFIGRLAYFIVDLRRGTNMNLEQCSVCVESANSFRVNSVVYSKYCGYSFWPRSSEYLFGVDSVFDSSFCINCYHSLKLTRCLEIDASRSCSDSCFCHNCENLHDSMFCFNAKNFSHAIGNAPLPAEQYRAVKSMLLEQIAGELARKKDLKWDIYNIGSERR